MRLTRIVATLSTLLGSCLAQPAYAQVVRAGGVQVSEQAASPIAGGQQGLWTPNAGGSTGKPLWRLSGGTDVSLTPNEQQVYNNGSASATGQVAVVDTSRNGIFVDQAAHAVTGNWNSAGGGSPGTLPTWGLTWGAVDSTVMSEVNGALGVAYLGVNTLGQIVGVAESWERQSFHFPAEADTLFIIDPSTITEGDSLVLIGGSTFRMDAGGGDVQIIAGNGGLGGGLLVFDAGLPSTTPATTSLSLGVPFGSISISPVQATSTIIGRMTDAGSPSAYSTIIYGGASNGISVQSKGPFAITAGALATQIITATPGGPSINNLQVGDAALPGLTLTGQSIALTATTTSGVGVTGKTIFHDHVFPFATQSNLLGQSGDAWAQVWSYLYAGVIQTFTTSGAVSIIHYNGSLVFITATGNITSIAIDAGVTDQKMILILTQDGAGTSTWPSTIAGVKFPGGSFSKTTSASAIDRIDLVSDGTTWYASSTFANLH